MSRVVVLVRAWRLQLHCHRQEDEVEENEGDRTASRPSAQARKVAVRRVREHLIADGIENDGWAEASVLMPDEAECQWSSCPALCKCCFVGCQPSSMWRGDRRKQHRTFAGTVLVIVEGRAGFVVVLESPQIHEVR